MEQNLELVRELTKFEAYYLSDYKNDIKPHQYGLLNGLSGIILVHLSLFELTNEPKYKEEIISNVNKIIETLEQQESYTFSFCSGLAGVGWMLHCLMEKQILVSYPEDFLEDFDQVLEEEIKELAANKNYDILHGALGIGLYFIKRGKRNIIEYVIECLDSDRIENNFEICWSKTEDNVTFHDMGLAHGNASILYFLTKCYENKIAENKCLHLLKGSVNFYLRHIKTPSTSTSFLPSKLLPFSYQDDKNSGISRLAWCYGDLGVLHTILLAYRTIGEYKNASEIITLLERTAKRQDPRDTKVMGSCFCHGSSGIAYIFLKLYEETGNLEFESAAKFWLIQTFNYRKNEHELDYHLDEISLEEWHPKGNLINGIGGIAILYLTYAHKRDTDLWNEAFFLK
ncbi:MAG: hypothetical protein DI535_16675 [Citrobacter freundii]|nr:MAG: hypothetical protein DI535_16675 [Citrobacter freundii]